MEINYKDIGKRIQEKRLELGITQEKLAETIDLTDGHLSGIENGKTKFSFPTIVNIANALNTSLDVLTCCSLVQGVNILQNEFSALLSDCTTEETVLIIDTVKSMKKSLKQKIVAGEG